MSLVLQFLVLGFTVIVWWVARRDLTRQAVERHTPAVQEWGRLQETVEMLIADLEQRATIAEKRVASAEQRMLDLVRQLDEPLSSSSPAPVLSEMATASDVAATPPTDVQARPVDAEERAHDERYAPLYALADSGVSDVAELARRTGLGQGEINLILSLRARRPHD